MAVAGLVLGASGGAFILIATAARSQYAQPPRTWLDQKIDDAREVRQVLARPLPPRVPLAPVTGRVTHAFATTRSLPKPVSRNPTTVQDVFAKVAPESPHAQLNAYAEFDRHAIH